MYLAHVFVVHVFDMMYRIYSSVHACAVRYKVETFTKRSITLIAARRPKTSLGLNLIEHHEKSRNAINAAEGEPGNGLTGNK